MITVRCTNLKGKKKKLPYCANYVEMSLNSLLTTTYKGRGVIIVGNLEVGQKHYIILPQDIEEK